MPITKKIFFALAAALLLVGAGCRNGNSSASDDTGRFQVQVDQPGVTVQVGTPQGDATATSEGEDQPDMRFGDDGSEREPGEREDGGREDDEEGGGGQAVIPPAPATGKTYTMAQVAAHASGSSCWSAIGGSVYDLTSWISAHPGGSQAILSLCGIDGTAAFDAQHGGQGRPEQELASLKIGTLVK